MDLEKYKKLFKDFCSKQLNVNLIDVEISIAKLYHFYKNCDNIDFHMLNTYENLVKNKSRSLYWIKLGFTEEQANINCKMNVVWNICKTCNKHYYENGYNTVSCSEKCANISYEKFKQNLSLSRKKYNSRDPLQYSKRHNLSLEESKKIVKQFSKSDGQLSFWLDKGYTEDEAIDKVSKAQRKKSKRCKEYWINHNFTEKEAIKKVSEHQSKISKNYHNNNTEKERKENSHFSTEYWKKRGFSEDESIENVSKVQRKISNNYIKNTPIEIRKEHNHLSIEYWKKHYPNDYIEKYSEHRNKIIAPSAFRSKISDDFFINLMEKLDLKIGDSYYLDKEFGIYNEELGYLRYDWINLNLMLCIEFYGDYWHANPDIYKSGEIISYPKGVKKISNDIWKLNDKKIEIIKEKGFDIIIIWEKNYKQNKNIVINETLNKIEEIYKRNLYENKVN